MINKEYSIKDIELMSDEEYDEYIENALLESEKELDDPNTKYLTHEEVFGKLRKKLNNEK